MNIRTLAPLGLIAGGLAVGAVLVGAASAAGSGAGGQTPDPRTSSYEYPGSFSYATSQSFMSIPGIPGESVVRGHVNQIDIGDVTGGMAAPALWSGGGGGGSVGKPTMQPITLSKHLDKTTPTLMAKMTKGQMISSVVIYVDSVDQENNAKPKYKITLTSALVTKDTFVIDSADNSQIENLELTYQKIQYDYFANGGSTPTTTFNYDVLANKTNS